MHWFQLPSDLILRMVFAVGLATKQIFRKEAGVQRIGGYVELMNINVAYVVGVSLFASHLYAVAATFTVTTTNNSGPGSFRQALIDANATVAPDVIQFGIPGTNELIIVQVSALPTITNSLLIDGYTQPGSQANSLQHGFNAKNLVNILSSNWSLNIQTSNTMVRGVRFLRFASVPAIHIQGGGSNVVEGCVIGTDADAKSNWGGGTPVRITSSSNNRIGGTNAAQRNVLGFSLGTGISLVSGSNNAFLGNTIYASEGLAIDLNNDNRTANDAGDADVGPNLLQNFPVLTNAALTPSGLSVQGFLGSRTSAVYRIEFFASPTCFNTNNAYARDYLGATNVTTDSSGFASISAVLSVPVPAGYFITATATDANGNTSEMGPCRQIPSPMYAVKPLGSLGYEFAHGNDINDNGDVVGFAFAGPLGNQTHAFLYTNGVMVDLGTLGGFHSFARAINGNRVVVGEAMLPDGTFRAFRWTNGAMHSLGTLPTGTNSWATHINASGQVVGYSQTSDFPGNTHAFLWQSNVMTDIGALPGHHGSEAWAIGDNGDVIGASWMMLSNGVRSDYLAFRYRNGVMSLIPEISPLAGTPARVNTQGDIACSLRRQINSPHGFVLFGTNAYDFGLFGNYFGQCNDINNSRWAVGYSSTPILIPEAGGARAVLFRDGNIFDLNTLLVSNPGTLFRTATAINTDGTILANNVTQSWTAYHLGPPGNNTTNVFLLLPVRLKVEKIGVNSVVSWLTNFSGFSLQSTTNITGGWQAVSDTPGVIGDRYCVTNNGARQRFFRLHRP